MDAADRESAPSSKKKKFNTNDIVGICIGLAALGVILWLIVEATTSTSESTSSSCCEDACNQSYGDGSLRSFQAACDGTVTATSATLEGYDATTNFCQCTCSQDLDASGPIQMVDGSVLNPYEGSSVSPHYMADRTTAYTFCCDNDDPAILCARGSPQCQRQQKLPLGAYQCQDASSAR